jgi:hypothetical protein
MLTRVLVGVLLFVLIVSGAAAWAADEPQTKSDSPTYDLFQQPTPGQRTFSAAATTPRKFTMPRTDSALSKLSSEQVMRLLMHSQGDCYTMRTYIVAREGNSDSTRPARYQECMPSSRVRMKNADER